MSSPLAAPLPWDLVASAYAAEVAPVFDHFAKAALELAQVVRGDAIVDVACGPGTLARRAARMGVDVAAIDFAPNMIARLNDHLAQEQLPVVATTGDGQALPYADARFDAGFSMFGLMFFPDRSAGFRELRRVVKPGGRVVVSSWQPMDAEPLFQTMFGALGKAMAARNPGAPSGPPPRFPLTSSEDYHAEMGAAGLSDIVVAPYETAISAPSTAALWANMQRTNAPLVLLREQLGSAFDGIAEEIGAALVARLGPGPQSVTMRAWLGVGVV